jgi:hypothetical protein
MPLKIKIRSTILVAFFLIATPLLVVAQTDEIQVYDGDRAAWDIQSDDPQQLHAKKAEGARLFRGDRRKSFLSGHS